MHNNLLQPGTRVRFRSNINGVTTADLWVVYAVHGQHVDLDEIARRKAGKQARKLRGVLNVGWRRLAVVETSEAAA